MRIENSRRDSAISLLRTGAYTLGGRTRRKKKKEADIPLRTFFQTVHLEVTLEGEKYTYIWEGTPVLGKAKRRRLYVDPSST